MRPNRPLPWQASVQGTALYRHRHVPFGHYPPSCRPTNRESRSRILTRGVWFASRAECFSDGAPVCDHPEATRPLSYRGVWMVDPSRGSLDCVAAWGVGPRFGYRRIGIRGSVCCNRAHLMAAALKSTTPYPLFGNGAFWLYGTPRDYHHLRVTTAVSGDLSPSFARRETSSSGVVGSDPSSSTTTIDDDSLLPWAAFRCFADIRFLRTYSPFARH